MKGGKKMSPCSGKRKRGESAEGEELSLKNTVRDLTLEDLGDELLIEILRRLPTAKSAVGFKLVSKKWSSVISTPYFRSQFITHNHYHAAYQFITHSAPSAVFVSHRDPLLESEDPELLFITDKEGQIFESPGFTLGFLPEEREFVSVVATCNDLMLCRAWKEYCPTNYYICNPFTMKWLLLPPPPMDDSGDVIDFGLVYEPNYQRWIQGINECRFRVVCIQSHNDFMHMYKYCSETGQWNKSPGLAAEFNVLGGNIIAHYGRLHWHYGRYVVAYDPFNNETFFMELFDSQATVNQGFNNGGGSVRFCLGVSQGFLQVMKFVSYFNRGVADYLIIWELKDPEARSLSLKNRIFFPTGSAFLQHPLAFGPIAFHPNDMDVVYMKLFDDSLIKCKIERGKLEVVGKSLCPVIRMYTREIFTTVLPWWPTPVPMLPQNSHVYPISGHLVPL